MITLLLCLYVIHSDPIPTPAISTSFEYTGTPYFPNTTQLRFYSKYHDLYTLAHLDELYIWQSIDINSGSTTNLSIVAGIPSNYKLKAFAAYNDDLSYILSLDMDNNDLVVSKIGNTK